MGRLLKALTLVLAGIAGTASAQDVQGTLAPVLVVESERMFSESLFGQRVAVELARLQAELVAQNAEMETSLTEEERELTEKRKTMAAEEFSALAREFDERVSRIRREQDAKFSEINELSEREQAVFIQAARPILFALMQETGAGVILERRTVLLSNDSVDITDEAIRRLNETLGEGRAIPAPQD
ncbi:periplasmic chaperone for outer membrane proteins Skp [Shimia isoporae]|uniref:Periplasmic chaperone for outer membrane proteins Skp n=1 Tax=Shimia isoporae TaxID=647720 RepID=A0A4R1NVG6_9RHOB|nr:OmpH family outer membrane protein [Shimia isoporae]TCL09268.1 periplasmic chaperone for outer membrane proteins Skp [Shimia isoporae]